MENTIANIRILDVVRLVHGYFIFVFLIMDQFRNDIALWIQKLRGHYDTIFIEPENVNKISWSKFVYNGNGELWPTNQNLFKHIWIDRNLTMGDEDDCFSPYKCVRLFPSENEWPWSLSEEDVLDRDEMSNYNRGLSIDASYQVSVHLAKQFPRRRI